jgi:hypothetical protein
MLLNILSCALYTSPMLVDVKVKVILLLTVSHSVSQSVSQSVSLGVEHSSGSRDQISITLCKNKDIPVTGREGP